MESILNFSQDLDIGLFEKIVSATMHSRNEAEVSY